MSSELRKKTSRENGAKSRGPVTVDGKARSALNSLRHGLLARDILLSCEDPDSFARHMAAYLKRLQPANDLELELVQEMGAAAWRMHRARGIEATMIDRRIGEFIVADEGRTRDAHTVVMEGFTRAVDSTTLSNLGRYETRLSRQIDRAFRMLIKLRESPVLQVPDGDPDWQLETENQPTQPEEPTESQPDAVSEPEKADESATSTETKDAGIPNEPNLDAPEALGPRVIRLQLVTKTLNLPKY